MEPGSYYNCDLLPFFELGSVHYNFYLINIRIPVLSKMKVNHDIGKIDDIQFIVRTTFFPQRLRDWLTLAFIFDSHEKSVYVIISVRLANQRAG